MITLALDTTTDEGSLALLSNGELLTEHAMMSADGFSHVLFRDLHEILERQGVRLSEINLFAAASGPGSFTGVRVSLATVKGLAEALGKEAVGVSNLMALATFGTEPLRAVLIDARRGEAYAAVYDHGLNLVSPEVVTQPQSWLESLDQPAYQFISQNPAWLSEILRSTRFVGMPAIAAPRHLAASVGSCAELRKAQGSWTDPVALDANYVRRSDVQSHWHDR